MKVLVISHLFPNEVDSILGVFVREQVKFLGKHCEIKVIAPIPWFPPIRGFGRWSRLSQIPYQQKVDGIEVFHPRYLLLPRRLLFCTAWFFYLLALLQADRRLEFDLVHAHVAYPDGLAATLFGKVVGKPVLITAHGSDVKVYPKEHKVWRMLTVRALLQADKIIAVSSELKREIGKLGVDLRKVKVIFNGVNPDLFHPLPKPTALSQKGLSKKSKRIIYIGGLFPEKGVRVLIEAMSILAACRDDVKMVLVGANEKGKSDKGFIQMVKSFGLQERVIFVNKVCNTEIPLWLAASDLLVLPSFSEGFGLSLVEALACGRPVVSTTCGGPEDIVTQEVGFLVPPGDVTALARAIAYVLDHPEEYDPVKISSYAHQRFNLEKISSQIFALYRSLVKVAY